MTEEQYKVTDWLNVLTAAISSIGEAKCFQVLEEISLGGEYFIANMIRDAIYDYKGIKSYKLNNYKLSKQQECKYLQIHFLLKHTSLSNRGLRSFLGIGRSSFATYLENLQNLNPKFKQDRDMIEDIENLTPKIDEIIENSKKQKTKK